MVIWSSDQVNMVRDARAREVLMGTGLPAEALNSGLFAASPELHVVTVDARELTQIGVMPGGGDAFYVDNYSGEVLSGSADDGELWHVNATVYQFAQCLDRVESSFPLYADPGDLESFAEAESRVRGILEEIDESVLDETGGFWDVFLHDIGFGNYS